MNPVWGPTIVSLGTAIFIAGSWWSTTKNHQKRLDDHEVKIEDLGTRMTASEAWFKGYEAGKGK